MTIDDERVKFYLRHREQLEEWLALRKDAAVAVDEWLTGLKPDLESLAESLDAEVIGMVEPSHAWPGLFLKRAQWPGIGLSDNSVVIGVQWARGKTLLGELSAPNIGVWTRNDSAVGRALTADPEFQTTRQQRKDKTTPFWRAYNGARPRERFPENADHYRQLLIDNVKERWTDYSGAIDRIARSLELTARSSP